MDCKICKAINSQNSMIYRDDKACVLLIKNSFSEGHLKVLPIEHYTILEQVPDELSGYLMNLAIKLSAMLFETLGLHGTNILVQNGISAGQIYPHFSIDIIPRRTNDNLNLKWQMNKAEHSSLESMKNIFVEALSSSEKSVEEEKKPEKKQEIKNSDDNLMIKHLKHIP